MSKDSSRASTSGYTPVELTVVYPGALYAPVQFNNFKTEAISMRVALDEDADPEVVYREVYERLHKLGTKQYEHAFEAWKRRYKKTKANAR